MLCCLRANLELVFGYNGLDAFGVFIMTTQRQLILFGAGMLFVAALAKGSILAALGVVFGVIVVFGLMEYFGYDKADSK